jgi:hypothetical protein
MYLPIAFAAFFCGAESGRRPALGRRVAPFRHRRPGLLRGDGAGDGNRTRDVQLGKLAFYR